MPIPNVAGVAPFAAGTPRATAPTPGQHTRDILRDHGFEAAEIDQLIERKVVAGPNG